MSEKSNNQVATTPISNHISFNAKYIAYAHTFFATSSFLAALAVGSYLHYYKIVENASFGYPDEWFPSVSATIGDRYPERSVFQIVIAMTAGPRFLLLAFNFFSLYKAHSYLPYIALVSGLLRTITAGGWMYITSTDDHDAHDVFMIAYIVLTIPWDMCTTLLSPRGSFQRKGRFYTGISFFGTLVPLIYWFIQHKVHVRPGAYSVYAYFEWSLIGLDILFDAWSALDFSDIEVTISGEGLKLISGQKKKSIQVTTTPIKSVESKDDFSSIEVVVNLINSYVYWTVLTSLFLCVWYFPLWYMGISGYEAVVLAIFLSPIVLLPRSLRVFLAQWPQFTRSLTVICGIGAYKFEDPEQKLLSITAGTVFGIISTVNEFWALSTQPRRSNSYIATFILGLLTTSILKFLFYSNNPIWPIMHKENGGYNPLGIFIGLIGAFFTPASKAEQTHLKKAPEKVGGSLLLGAIGFGGYYFTLQALLSDSGTLALWTWEGFPIRGPTPVTGAFPHILTFAVALLVTIKVHPNVFSSWSYNIIVGGGSAVALYFLKNWAGFFATLVFVFYIVSIAPLIFHSLTGYNPVGIFFLGHFFNILISLASVWIVAYAFVPGGPLLRERTDIVLATAVLSIFVGVANYNLRKDEITKISFYSSKTVKQISTITTILLAVALSTSIKRWPTGLGNPYHPETETFSAGIWCVHFGLDNDMWSSETRMRDLIKDAELDIIGLLETDTQRLIGGNRDFTQKIAEDLGMYVDYGPGPNKHTWGAALLSKFPIVQSTHHLLPSPVGELAPAIHATLDIYGNLVDVVVFHSGQEEDVEDRRLQSLGVEEIMANSERPLVLLSYLVTDPLVGNYNTYVSEKSRMHDIDSTDWDRWCEYILFRDLRKIAYARISRSTITDTELQIAKFGFGGFENHDYHFVDEDLVDENLRMPQLFKGDGVRGHRYHVFDEPRYFAPGKE
ncbi:CWH43 [Candida theae]|uniref:CWH43 n=1 Tax=Candida theae TaxID=1198502 RepID=A0AAD5BD15_9ASCO|nr:CWH43 [Candida theae]KAI5955449.1 CWH43 [Candida theae]